MNRSTPSKPTRTSLGTPARHVRLAQSPQDQSPGLACEGLARSPQLLAPLSPAVLSTPPESLCQRHPNLCVQGAWSWRPRWPGASQAALPASVRYHSVFHRDVQL
ncbi:unnamed protein product [Effrenium voratum]|nr:unnamed protein product [Effrenium voratum]CAJ1426719.1 unnamed protein product [Effrenium voratum]